MDKYQLENARLLRLYLAREHIGEPSERITEADRIRLRFVADFAASRLIRMWLDGELTWRRLWRIASELPGAHDEQVRALVRKS